MSLEQVLGIIGIIVAVIAILFAWFFTFIYYRKQKKELEELKKKELEEKNKPILNVIAWIGIGDRDISQKFSNDHKIRLNCLEYVRGITGVTKLRMEKSPFDVAVIDREFLGHFNHGKIVPLESRQFDGPSWERIEKQWKEIPESLTNMRMIPNKLGIPVRCGLNAILANMEVVKKVNNNKKILSYDFMSFDRLRSYDTNLKIVIWNWYLPSLCVFLLANGIKINEVKSQEQGIIKRMVKGLKSLGNRIILCDTIDQVHGQICNDKAWIIPGGAGWLLPRPTEYIDTSMWEVVVPQEGAFLWVECASVLKDSWKKEKATQYIEFLLEKETQRMICTRKDSYQACPVMSNSIRDVAEQDLPLSDKLNIFDQTEKHMLKTGIEPRPLPFDPRMWEKEWEEFVGTLGKDQRAG